MDVLNTRDKWLSCSLIQKFGAAEEGDIDTFIGDIRSHLPQDFYPKGELFVFVDECHRTQSGKLHDAMKELLPAAVLIGFTGTPLLKDDKKRSIETFGPYIHTYKYDQAVNDDVVLDLRYEARDIDQDIVAPDKIDEWFELKTKALTDAAKAQLRQRWGTMQKVLSSQDRLQKIVADILLDMERCDRLKSGRGNALLVSGSIYSACRIFEMFQQHGMGKKCAIVTSYRPSPSDIKGEETGEGLTEKLRQHEIYRKMLAAHFNEPEETAIHKVQKFEKNVKRRFVKEPGQMKLLIVVDKLLTGFDAPPATYLYIDKHMQEHGLFQAICRVNRLDGEDKEYGYIIDYKDLFRSLEQSIKDYTGEAFAGYDRDDVEGLLKDRLEQGRKRLEQTREAIKALCEPVNRPCDTADYLRYFCVTDNADVEQLKANEPKRAALYKSAAAYLRAYANLANEMIEAGYNDTEIRTIKAEVDHYEKACREVKLASGDYIDMKLYEPAMRHLLDTYIRAEDSKQLSILDDMTLVELIVERGESAVDSLPDGIRNDHEAVAATVENNLRRLIVDEMAVNPKYYTEMSKLLDALILQRKQEALDYKAYLVKIVELTRNTTQPKKTRYPYTINNPGRRALYDNLKEHAHDLEEHILKNKAADTAADAVETATLALDDAIRSVKKADWRGNRFKEREVRNAIKSVLGDREDLVDEFFEIVKAQYDY